MTLAYSQKFELALAFFCYAHRDHKRKGGGVPYFSHLMAVSALVWKYGGDEETAIAALGHDYPEDCFGNAPEQGVEKIRRNFGDRVADIVWQVTEPNKNLPWQQRKEAYLEQIVKGSFEAALVSASDKLDNFQDYIRSAELEDAFNKSLSLDKRKQIIWFGAELATAYKLRLSFNSQTFHLALSMEQVVDRLGELWEL